MLPWVRWTACALSGGAASVGLARPLMPMMNRLMIDEPSLGLLAAFGFNLGIVLAACVLASTAYAILTRRQETT
jgi:ABC-type branched-subunit amino acid transport system ATPase component